MELSSMTEKEAKSAIGHYYKIYNGIRKTLATLDKNINDLYNDKTTYVVSSPKDDSISKDKKVRTN